MAKGAGTTHCYGGVCHRVLSIQETVARIGVPIRMHASHYDSCERDRFNPCGLTSSGEKFNADRADNAASVIYPDGTVILAYNAANKRAVVLRINNLGPFKGNRVLDVSRGAAQKLGFEQSGVAPLWVTVLKAPQVHETKYQSHRVYPRVPGYIGEMKSVEEAVTAASSALGSGPVGVKTALASIVEEGNPGKRQAAALEKPPRRIASAGRIRMTQASLPDDDGDLPGGAPMRRPPPMPQPVAVSQPSGGWPGDRQASVPMRPLLQMPSPKHARITMPAVVIPTHPMHEPQCVMWHATGVVTCPRR